MTREIAHQSPLERAEGQAKDSGPAAKRKSVVNAAVAEAPLRAIDFLACCDRGRGSMAPVLDYWLSAGGDTLGQVAGFDQLSASRV